MAEPEHSKKPPSNLLLRSASAAVLGPVILLLTYFGGLPYAFVMLAVAMLFLWEWCTITGTKALSIVALSGHAALVFLTVLVVAGYPQAGLALLIFASLFGFAGSRFSRTGRWGVEGILYSGLALYSLLAIRAGTGGLLFSFFLLIVVWATDIFAYCVGRTVGGPKLWTRVSPKKTWSGALGGLLLAMVFGGAVAVVGQAENLLLWVILAATLSIVSQAGDLLESAVKRRFDVKDSSQLIPGHGGIMDRIDGLVAAAIGSVLLGLAFGGTFADPLVGLALG